MLSDDIRSLVEAVLSDLALRYRIDSVAQSERATGMWSIRFVDATAPIEQREFEIAIGRVDAAQLDHPKAEVAKRLLERQSE